MFDMIKKILTTSPSKDANAETSQQRLQVATCALFVEMAMIDGDFSNEERTSILNIMNDLFDVTTEQTQEIIEAASAEVDNSIDSWYFTNLLNTSFSKPERVTIVEYLWKLVLADGHMDKHEAYLTKKVSGLLKLSHEEFISAKQKALRRD